jgi:hypothetical protein
LAAGTSSTLFALAVNGGDLYAGGEFTQAGAAPASSIARWDGTSWSPMGIGPARPGGTNNVVFALAVSGSDVYVGGNFTTAGRVAASRVAKWNGTSWSPLGTGVDATVYALAVSGNDALGAGMTGGNVSELAVSGNDLYAAGGFRTAGGVTANGIAKWNGTSWSALGTGSSNGFISALAVSGADVYVGGQFTAIGGVTANSIAKWNGTSWSALGTGIGNTVYALAVSGTDLYAGGIFIRAGTVTANNIAKWDGTSWSALGTGTGTSFSGTIGVQALAVSGNDLYAGGMFPTVSGLTVNNIARWDGTSWNPLGTGLNSQVYGLAISTGGQLNVGGSFSTVGDGSKVMLGFGIYDERLASSTAAKAGSRPVLTVHPNPAHTRATLSLAPAAQTRTVELLDALGQVVRTGRVPAHAAAAVLELGGLPAGVYTVRCGEASTKLVVE